MTNWTCQDCDGDGMRYSEERKAMVICLCPVGERKRVFLKLTREERQKERRGRGKRKKPEERVPF